MGMLPGSDREKLFAKNLAGLTLSKAMELAENARSARAAAGAGEQAAPREVFKVTQAPGPATPPQRKAIPSSDFKGQCQVCGYHNHETSQCRFAKAKCRKCNATGHLRKMCKKINFVDLKAEDESDDDVFAK
ncbi:uncharacterized protein LOC113506079 [Trichoplusia ni]|uniref:Uncharacterized protein LOC113506079 n=1 Tax=Trichoplusia ni TaxID=7111 RepID=A0A7E5WV77_TRINI|nr:uncharacterized protein LOC113506079 [Trichoplusia ni]